MKNSEIRPVCREFAREITQQEMDLVSGGVQKKEFTGKASGSTGDWDVEIDITIEF